MLHELTLIIFLSCYVISHVFLFISLNFPFTPKKKIWRELMLNWTDERIKENNSVATVQILRNHLITNSAFISALLVILGVFLGVYPSRFTEAKIFPNLFDNLTVADAQIIIITFSIVSSVFVFILSNRRATSLSFMLTSNIKKEIEGYSGRQLAQETYLSTKKFWLLGIRGLYFIIAVITWLANPILCIITTIGITIYLTLYNDIGKFSNTNHKIG